MKYIIANWKAHMNHHDVTSWLHDFTSQNLSTIDSAHTVIICPPSPFLSMVAEVCTLYSWLHVGAQDVSAHPKGDYTGEVPAHTLEDIATYCLVGHSERREHMHESDTVLLPKIEQLKAHSIHSIYCVRGDMDTCPESADMIAFEPVDAIGSGRNMPVEEVKETRQRMSIEGRPFIYGGSVDETNIVDYLRNDAIDGVLVGSASRNPHSFFAMLQSLSSI